MMRLVERGKVDLDSPVRRYIPDFAVADESASATVTVRQLLNHTAGWDGRNGQDFGRGDDAVALYVKAMTRLPQLTPPGTAFAYNNSGLVVAGRIIELVAGTTYESTVQRLLLDPLQLAHTRYFSDQIIGLNVAASHSVVDGKPIAVTDFWTFPRSCNPTGGLMSTARDQLRYAQFHLGDGRAPNGEQILSRQSLKAMRSNPGAGGTLWVELTGMGVTWMLRPSAENVTIVEHGGTWKGQRSGFVMVPDRNFAMTVLTNSDGGFHMINDLFASDWALQRFAGLSNLPATPQRLGAVDLAPYEGRYIAKQVAQNGELEKPGTASLLEARAPTMPTRMAKTAPIWASPSIGPTMGSTLDPTTSPPAVAPTCAGRTATSPGSVASTAVCSDANSTAPAGLVCGARRNRAIRRRPRLWARPWTRQQAHRQSLQRARAGRQHRLVL